MQQKILDVQWSPKQKQAGQSWKSECFEIRKLSHGERSIARKLRHRGKTRRKLHISHPIEDRPQAVNERSEWGIGNRILLQQNWLFLPDHFGLQIITSPAVFEDSQEMIIACT